MHFSIILIIREAQWDIFYQIYLWFFIKKSKVILL